MASHWWAWAWAADVHTTTMHILSNGPPLLAATAPKLDTVTVTDADAVTDPKLGTVTDEWPRAEIRYQKARAETQRALAKEEDADTDADMDEWLQPVLAEIRYREARAETQRALAKKND